MEYLAIFLSEFFGTFALIVIGCSVNAGVNLKKTYSNNSGWIVISFGWGFGIMVGATIALASGGHLNPAVTIAQWSVGMISADQAAMYIFSELAGAFIGAIVVIFLFWSHFKETLKDESLISGTFYTGGAVKNNISNFMTEVVATFFLVIVVFSTIMYGAFNAYGPLIVGLTVVGIGLSLGGLTGFAINPARDLMPRLAHFIIPIPNKGKTNWSYSWIPLIGPIVGGLLAAGILVMIVGIDGTIIIPDLNVVW